MTRQSPPATALRPGPARRRALRSIAGSGVVVALLGGWPVQGAAAGCVGPVLAVGPVPPDGSTPPTAAVTIGSVATVTGEWFRAGCDDTGQGAGCRAPASEEEPLRDVELVLRQGEVSVRLGTADAADRPDRYGISWRGRVPATLRPGPATLHAAGTSLPVELRAP